VCGNLTVSVNRPRTETDQKKRLYVRGRTSRRRHVVVSSSLPARAANVYKRARVHDFRFGTRRRRTPVRQRTNIHAHVNRKCTRRRNRKFDRVPRCRAALTASAAYRTGTRAVVFFRFGYTGETRANNVRRPGKSEKHVLVIVSSVSISDCSRPYGSMVL